MPSLEKMPRSQMGSVWISVACGLFRASLMERLVLDKLQIGGGYGSMIL
jgi:hypothetical protein